MGIRSGDYSLVIEPRLKVAFTRYQSPYSFWYFIFQI